MQPATAPRLGYVPLRYNLNYGPQPQKMVCPNCSANIKTCTKLKAKSSTHVWACALCVCLCWLCCCCPYCINSCNNVTHSCPNCKSFLGTYNS